MMEVEINVDELKERSESVDEESDTRLDVETSCCEVAEEEAFSSTRLVPAGAAMKDQYSPSTLCYMGFQRTQRLGISNAT
jgi:hypothetical protein